MAGSPDRTTSIPFSKYNIVLLSAASLIFVAFGAWLLFTTDKQATTLQLSQLLGGLTLLIFIPAAAVALYHLADKKPGLILDANGLRNKTSGQIAWQDIARISVTHVRNQRCLIFFLSDPKKYISTGNAVQRKQRATNLRLYGSPVRLSAETLTISFDELHALVTTYHEQYRS